MADLLVVDDDLDLADLLAESIRRAGHACRVAHDGREALRLVAIRRPDLVLLDVEMPILNGPETAYALFLRNCGDENIPVILISGVIDLGRIAARVGTPYHLAKPYTLEAVLGLIGRALQERVPPRPARQESTS